ncbi:mechanosensitive ion channel [bacterium]|nr:mechanosensitive ion channel [bacterium]
MKRVNWFIFYVYSVIALGLCLCVFYGYRYSTVHEPFFSAGSHRYLPLNARRPQEADNTDETIHLTPGELRKNLRTDEKFRQKFLSEEPFQYDLKTEDENRSIIGIIRHVIKNIWHFEVLAIAGRKIILRNIVFAALFFFLGIRMAYKFSLTIPHRSYGRKRLSPNAASAVSKTVRYILYVLIFLFSLNVLNIPLTVFTLFGGAFAIAVGFGAQNLLNNFLSGLIIMTERPIKINDVIEIDGNYGRVIDIGARCTLIKLSSGIEVLVPNSSILEKNVINWTHSDNLVRFSVSVGVAYGSPIRDVKRLLEQAVTADKRILTDPEPVILFAEFGDNALQFEVFFWIRVDNIMDSRIIRSDLRMHIDSLFRHGGITIAYPQRDVHLNTIHPIEIKMVGNNDQKLQTKPVSEPVSDKKTLP